ncbi:MAG: hypothetical protein AB1782_04790 [Cyanobacteriota bacterium]
MKEELDKLTMKSVLSTNEVTFSSLENVLAKKFNISAEQLREMLIGCDSVEDLLEQLGINQEVK